MIVKTLFSSQPIYYLTVFSMQNVFSNILVGFVVVFYGMVMNRKM
jgi:hypothetical protein